MNESLKDRLRILLGKPPVQQPKPTYLNEAINFEKECIFIAIPKTGTNSVRLQILQGGTPLIANPHLDILQIRDALYTFLLMQALGSNRGFPSESVVENRELRERSRTVFESFFKFSAVRNPWARAASLYFRNEGVQLKEKMSFGEFCERHLYASDTCYHPTRHKNQLDWLCDESGECVMDYVYKVEDFAQAIEEIRERTNGRLALANRTANYNPNSKSHHYRELYNDKARQLVARTYEKDIDHFKYTF